MPQPQYGGHVNSTETVHEIAAAIGSGAMPQGRSANTSTTKRPIHAALSKVHRYEFREWDQSGTGYRHSTTRRGFVVQNYSP